MTDRHDFARRYAEAWCSKNPPSVAAFFSEDGSLSVNDNEPAQGREAISEVADGFMSAFPDLVVRFDELVEHDMHTAFHWTLTGTNTGPEGTGNKVRISGQEQWQFAADGLIGESKGYFDADEYARQLEQGVD